MVSKNNQYFNTNQINCKLFLINNATFRLSVQIININDANWTRCICYRYSAVHKGNLVFCKADTINGLKLPYINVYLLRMHKYIDCQTINNLIGSWKICSIWPGSRVFGHGHGARCAPVGVNEIPKISTLLVKYKTISHRTKYNVCTASGSGLSKRDQVKRHPVFSMAQHSRLFSPLGRTNSDTLHHRTILTFANGVQRPWDRKPKRDEQE